MPYARKPQQEPSIIFLKNVALQQQFAWRMHFEASFHLIPSCWRDAQFAIVCPMMTYEMIPLASLIKRIG